MLNIKAMPLLLKIIARIDIKPVIEKVRGLDVFKDAKNPQEALKELKSETAVEVAAEVLAVITPQFDKIADYIPELVAAYKGVTVEEAERLDAADVINEIVNDDGIKTFFSHALRRKVEQTA